MQHSVLSCACAYLFIVLVHSPLTCETVVEEDCAVIIYWLVRYSESDFDNLCVFASSLHTVESVSLAFLLASEPAGILGHPPPPSPALWVSFTFTKQQISDCSERCLESSYTLTLTQTHSHTYAYTGHFYYVYSSLISSRAVIGWNERYTDFTLIVKKQLLPNCSDVRSPLLLAVSVHVTERETKEQQETRGDKQRAAEARPYER